MAVFRNRFCESGCRAVVLDGIQSVIRSADARPDTYSSIRAQLFYTDERFRRWIFVPIFRPLVRSYILRSELYHILPFFLHRTSLVDLSACDRRRRIESAEREAEINAEGVSDFAPVFRLRVSARLR